MLEKHVRFRTGRRMERTIQAIYFALKLHIISLSFIGTTFYILSYNLSIFYYYYYYYYYIFVGLKFKDILFLKDKIHNC